MLIVGATTHANEVYCQLQKLVPREARHPTVPDWDVFGNVGWLHVIEWRFRGCGGRPCGVGRLSVLCLFLGDAHP